MVKGKEITYRQKWLIWLVCVVVAFTYFGLFVYGQPHQVVVYMIDPNGNEDPNVPVGQAIEPWDAGIFAVPFTFAVLGAFGLVYEADALEDKPKGKRT